MLLAPLFFLNAQSEPVLPSAQKVTSGGKIIQLKVRPEDSLPEEAKSSCRKLVVDDQSLSSQATLTLEEGKADFKILPGKKLSVCLWSSRTVLKVSALKKNQNFDAHYLIERGERVRVTSLKHEKASVNGPSEKKLSSYDFRFYAGAVYHRHQNIFNQPFAQQTWAGSQFRVQADVTYSRPIFRNFFIHANVRLDSFNSSLSCEYRGNLSLDRPLIHFWRGEVRVGLGVSNLVNFGSAPYGISLDLSPLLETEFRSEDLKLNFVYSPLYITSLGLGDALYEFTVIWNTSWIRKRLEVGLSATYANVISPLGSGLLTYQGLGAGLLFGFALEEPSYLAK